MLRDDRSFLLLIAILHGKSTYVDVCLCIIDIKRLLMLKPAKNKPNEFLPSTLNSV